jgi:hypothetical protein
MGTAADGDDDAVREVTRRLVDELLAQPAPVRLLVGVLAIGAGAVAWWLAPRMVSSTAEPRPDARAESWVRLVGWSSRIGTRLQAVTMIVLGAALTVDALGGD